MSLTSKVNNLAAPKVQTYQNKPKETSKAENIDFDSSIFNDKDFSKIEGSKIGKNDSDPYADKKTFKASDIDQFNEAYQTLQNELGEDFTRNDLINNGLDDIQASAILAIKYSNSDNLYNDDGKLNGEFIANLYESGDIDENTLRMMFDNGVVKNTEGMNMGFMLTLEDGTTISLPGVPSRTGKAEDVTVTYPDNTTYNSNIEDLRINELKNKVLNEDSSLNTQNITDMYSQGILTFDDLAKIFGAEPEINEYGTKKFTTKDGYEFKSGSFHHGVYSADALKMRGLKNVGYDHKNDLSIRDAEGKKIVDACSPEDKEIENAAKEEFIKAREKYIKEKEEQIGKFFDEDGSANLNEIANGYTSEYIRDKDLRTMYLEGKLTKDQVEEIIGTIYHDSDFFQDNVNRYILTGELCK